MKAPETLRALLEKSTTAWRQKKHCAGKSAAASLHVAMLNRTRERPRHSFVPHFLENGANIRSIHELLGHGSVKTTRCYTHSALRDARVIRSPFDTP
jgi:site-specific recombinase XerD